MSPSFIEPTADDPQSERPSTPPAPSYSPITPPITLADPASGGGGYPHRPPEDDPQPPAPVPFSESDNTDAMALRSAISILQIQRQKAQRDMKALEEQKKVALADPEGFANAVAAGKVKTASSGGLFVGPNPDTEHDGSSNDDEEGDTGTETDSHRATRAMAFRDIPGPQNVVRCPPVNWAKYHVVGEPLDRMHDEQRRRPDPGQPHVDEEPKPAPEHVIAAPYSPWTDKLPETSMRTRSVAKREA